MGKIYFSPSSGGFYPEDLREIYEASDAGWPEDALEVTQADYESLLAGQQDNKVIVAGFNGYPVLQDIEPPTTSQLQAIADAKKISLMTIATEKISPLQDAVDLGMATDDEANLLLDWKKYRVLLNRVDTSSSEIIWTEPPAA